MVKEDNTMTFEQMELLKAKAGEICSMYKAEADNLMIEGQISSEEWFEVNKLLNEKWFEICGKISDAWYDKTPITTKQIEEQFKLIV